MDAQVPHEVRNCLSDYTTSQSHTSCKFLNVGSKNANAAGLSPYLTVNSYSTRHECDLLAYILVQRVGYR